MHSSLAYVTHSVTLHQPINYTINGYAFLIQHNNLSYYKISVKGLVPLKLLDSQFILNSTRVQLHFYINCTDNNEFTSSRIHFIEKNVSDTNKTINIILPGKCQAIRYPLIWSFNGSIKFFNKNNNLKIYINIKLNNLISKVKITNSTMRNYTIYITDQNMIPRKLTYEIYVDTKTNLARIIKINNISKNINLGYNPFYLTNLKNAKDYLKLKSNGNINQKYLNYTLIVKPVTDNDQLLFIQTSLPINLGYVTYKNFLREVTPGKPLFVLVYQYKDIDIRDYLSNVTSYRDLKNKITSLNLIISPSPTNISKLYPGTFLPIKLSSNSIKLFQWASEPGVTDIGCYVCGYPFKATIGFHDCHYNFILPLNKTTESYLFFVIDSIKYDADFDPLLVCSDKMGYITSATWHTKEIIIILLLILVIIFIYKKVKIQ